ncbi:MAG: hypothetical protein ABSD68_01690 [Candidatus Micrarchaeales archaeon]|jgi:hypothetical protein
MAILEYFKNVLSAHSEILFDSGEATTDTLSIRDSFVLYFSISIIPIILFLVVGAIFFGSQTGQNMPTSFFDGLISLLYAVFITGNFSYIVPVPFVGFEAVLYLIALYILVIFPIEMILIAAALHLVGNNVFHEFKEPFENTFAAVMYAIIPQITFLWVLMLPVFTNSRTMFWYNLIVFTWSILIFFNALSNQQEINRSEITGLLGKGAMIILILFVLALIATFTGGLGVFSGASVLGTACVAGPGFLCTGMSLSPNTGALTATIGQATGTDWSSAYFMVAIQGNSINQNYEGPEVPPGQVWTGNAAAGLKSGQTSVMSFNILPAGSAVGTTAAGSMWACYTVGSGSIVSYSSSKGCTSTNGKVYYTQISTFTVKSGGGSSGYRSTSSCG